MKRTQTENIIFYLILFLASFVRLYKLGELPLGLDQDEAYSGYEAFSLLTTGHDSWGYRFPMYFISWEGGMNTIYAYLTIPFVALLDLTAFTIRLPQALFSLLSCYVFYRLLRLMFPRPIALFGFFLSAIIPWQLLIVRRGLEANIAPFFILTGFYFFARSIKNKDYLLLSAIFYGLGLYAYATAWIFITITFGFQLTYLFLHKNNQSITLTILISGLIFTIFAFPILLFILVNNNIISEITTTYFSIPKLISWRQDELGLNNLSANTKRILSIIITGTDGLQNNAFSPYGIFYPISLPFMLYGLYVLLKKSIMDIKKQEFSLNLCILFSLCIGVLYCTTFNTYINRANFLWFFFLISIVTGLSPFIIKPHLNKLLISTYLIFFISFSHTFLTKFNSKVADWFNPDFKSTLEIAETAHNKTSLPIKILETQYMHPKILFYTKTPTNDYISTVKWQKNFLNPVASFTHYYFTPYVNYEHPSPDAIYIAPSERLPFFHEFNTRVVGTYLIAVPKKPSQPL